MAATALGAGSAELRGRYLPGLLAGESVFAVAIDEGPKHRPERIKTRAERAGQRLQADRGEGLRGPWRHRRTCWWSPRALPGSDADADGITLFAVPKDAAGLSQDAVRLVDSAMATHVKLDNVQLDADAVIGEVDGGRALLNRVLNAGRIGAAAESVGVAARCV